MEIKQVYLFGNNQELNNEELYLLQLAYPACSMNYDNKTLIIRSIFPTCKSTQIVTNYEEFKEKTELKQLLLSCISKNQFQAKQILSKQLYDMLSTDEFKNNNLLYEIFYDKLSEIINTDDDTISTDIYQLEFNQYLIKFLESGSLINEVSLKNLMNYSNGLNILAEINSFTPVVNECLIDPLKIIFNFGAIEETFGGSLEQFDLDIKVRILDETEKYNAVGWKCGYLNTSYLNWITADNTNGRTRSSYC